MLCLQKEEDEEEEVVKKKILPSSINCTDSADDMEISVMDTRKNGQTLRH